MRLTQICGCSHLSNHWSIRCPCFCFGSACGVWLRTCLLCLHIQHQRQSELSAGKQTFGMLFFAELQVWTVSGVHCYQWMKLLNIQWLKKRIPESFWGTVVSVSAFFKLLMTVSSLVCGDRAHTNAPLSSTLNCLTQWKWSIMEFLPDLLVLLLLYNISIGSSQYTNRYVFSIWILSAKFIYLLI